MADDAALVERYLAGDHAALGAIHDRYADRIHDLCRSILGSGGDADDAFQDTFLTAATKLGQLRDRQRLRPWLYSIARNQCRARLRGRRRATPMADAGVDEAHEVDMTAPIVRRELAALVAEARDGLSTRDREVLDLHLRHGLEGDDLAAVLGVSTQSAYKLVQRVRGRIERSMGALLVARHGARDCAELAALVDATDGVFGPAERKRISRHIDDCDTCDANRRRLLDPSGLASAMPIPPAPAAVRARVGSLLADGAAPGHELRHWRRDGFPGRGRRARTFLTVAGAALVALVVATATVLAVDVLPLDDAERSAVDVVAPTSMPTEPTAPPHDRSTTVPPGPAAPSTSTPPATVPSSTVPSTTRPASTTTAVPPPVAPPATTPPSTGAPVPPSSTTSTTSSTSTTTTSTTTTTVPRDRTAPVISAFRMTPTLISEVPAAARSCGWPTGSTAVVQATDAGGVAAVLLEWIADGGGSGVVALTEGGGGWTGTLSFPSGTFPTVTFVTVSARAVDDAGNVAVSRNGFRIEVIPCS